MHEHEGFFCKTVNSWIMSNFADPEKTSHGPKLAGPTALERAAHIGRTGRRESGAVGRRIWAAGMQPTRTRSTVTGEVSRQRRHPLLVKKQSSSALELAGDGEDKGDPAGSKTERPDQGSGGGDRRRRA